MKTIKAFINNLYSVADLCNERNCELLTFKEEDILFVSSIQSSSCYSSENTYHRTVCLKGYGLIEILSKNRDDLFIEGFDNENL